MKKAGLLLFLVSIFTVGVSADVRAGMLVDVTNVSDSDSGNFTVTGTGLTSETGFIATVMLGIDSAGFIASTVPAAGPISPDFDTTSDTLQFTVRAKPTYRIVSLSYAEELEAVLTAGSIAFGRVSIAVGGEGTKSETELFTAGLGDEKLIQKTLDIDVFTFGDGTYANGLDHIFVSVDNLLAAVGPGATLGKTAASLLIGVAPVPLPAPLLLMSVALAALFIFRRAPSGLAVSDAAVRPAHGRECSAAGR